MKIGEKALNFSGSDRISQPEYFIASFLVPESRLSSYSPTVLSTQAINFRRILSPIMTSTCSLQLLGRKNTMLLTILCLYYFIFITK